MIITWVTTAFSVVGSIIRFDNIYGGILAIIKMLVSEIRRKHFYYAEIRFTSKITLGLEFFIAGNLIKTITEPTSSQISTLAVIVCIRK